MILLEFFVAIIWFRKIDSSIAKYSEILVDINCGGVKVPDDTACQWTIHSNILFQEIVNNLCNVLMAISKYPGFGMDKKICNCSCYY